ncbi:hypothetical protein DVH05_009772 [Phytophthora capsici]|nr:hypothetical protein DVH05_009772 [Phytophthora capsici]
MAIQDGSFGWTTDTPLLSNVNLTVRKGDLVIVYGSVGRGKSSLCSALLGEMDKLAVPYNKEKYSKVIAACGLLPDLKQFPGGDATEVGQKGVNLSGGQKARVCLPRA